jgi:hypothetical protein
MKGGSMTYMERLEAKRAKVQQCLGAMTPAEAALHREICRVRGWTQVAMIPPDELERQLCVTPFLGGYGTAGYVVTLEGSPPRFLAVVVGGDPATATIRVLLPRLPRMREIDQYRPAKWQPLRAALLAYIGQHLHPAEVVEMVTWPTGG